MTTAWCSAADHDRSSSAIPRPGWVEHDPEQLWSSVTESAADALAAAGVSAADMRAIGITNQRETTVLWDRSSGRRGGRRDRVAGPPHGRCLLRSCRPSLIRELTGLVPDPYFSATKLAWLLEHAVGSPEGLAFGTVDSWLIWKLTGGEVHATDPTNASRTMLCSLRTLRWDDRLLELFGVPADLLPEIRPSSGMFGEARLLGARLPVMGVAGDQQAALFGQACLEPGQAKVTYGTGSFLLVNDGERRDPPPHGLVRTAAAQPGVTALEGSVFASGAAVQWLRDGLGILADAGDSDALAASLDGNDGVYFVPALAGLGSPWWDADARGLITGLTRGSTRAHLARAALEAIAYQVRDVVEAIPGGRDRAARRRRRGRQRLADAVPGRPAGRGRGGGRGARDDGAGRRCAGVRPAPGGRRREGLRAAHVTRPGRRAAPRLVGRGAARQERRSR